MTVWLVECYVELANTTVLGLWQERGAALDAANAAANRRADLRCGEPQIQGDADAGAVTYSVGDHHYTAMPMDVQ